MRNRCDVVLVNLDMEVLYAMEPELFPLWVAKHLIEGSDKHSLNEIVRHKDDKSVFDLLNRTGKFFNISKNARNRRLYLSMGLLSVASALCSSGFDVEYYDFSESKETIHTFADFIRRKQPRIIGFGPITSLFPQSILLSNIAKNISPSTVVIMGGHHVSALDIETLEKNFVVDVVVRGEGEITTPELVDALLRNGHLNKIKGVTYRDIFGNVHRNINRPQIKEMDQLEFPLLDLINPESNYIMNFSLSRGCPYRCTFCSDSFYWNHTYRSYSAEKLASYLVKATNKYPNVQLMCSDSNLFVNSDVVEKFSLLLPERFFSKHCSSVLVRVDNLNEKNRRIIQRLGFDEVYVGCENADDRILKDMNKKIEYKETRRRLECFSQEQHDFKVSALWIVGFPTENKVSASKNSDSIKQFLEQGLVDDVDPNLFVPHPGTDVFMNSVNYGLQLKHKNWRSYDYHQKPVFDGKFMNSDEIWRYYIETYKLIIRQELNAYFPSKEKQNSFFEVCEKFSGKLLSEMTEYFCRKGLT